MPFIPDNMVNRGSFIPDRPVRPLQGQPKGLIEENRDSLAIRGVKQFANIVPETLKEGFWGLGGGKITSWFFAKKLNKELKKRGIEPPSLRDTQKLIKAKVLEATGIPEFETPAPTTTGEKAVDIATGIGKFMVKLAVLKKAFPGASEAALWEMENLSSGGVPGAGYAMHGAFSAPGKIIKGTTTAAKAGRIGLESASLATLAAVEQKIDTGEINPVQVGIAAGLPIALRTPKIIKKLWKKRNPKIVKAVAEQTGQDINIYKDAKGNKYTDEQLVMKSAGKGKTKMVVKDTNIEVTLDQTASGSAMAKPADKEILDWSAKAKLLNKTERKAAVKKLRETQAAKGKEAYKSAREAGVGRFEAFKKARKAYGGKADVPEIEPLKLTSEQKEFYGKKIEQAYPEEKIFQRTGAATAFEKMEAGKIPTNYEFSLLEPVLGRSITKNLYMDLIKKRPFSGWEVPALVIQGFKTKFGLDIQTFRQARSLALRHPLLYLKSSWVNARAYISNKYAEKVFTNIQNSPGYKEAEKLGWNFVGEAGYSSKRLEYYSLGLTERLLTSKSKTLRTWGKFLEASERGAVAGINTMQKGLYDIHAKNVRNLNLKPAQQKLYLKNRAKTCNTFMKILRVPKGKKYAGLRKLKQVANYLLFSPSMTAARPLQIKALAANTGSKKYAAEVIASNIASIFAITSIPAIIGHQQRLQNPSEVPDVNGELNVLESGWGKIRWHDTIFDFSGGDAPFYRTLARIGVSAYMYGKEKATDQRTTEFRGRKIPTAGDTLKRYLETRETAALGYAKTMLTGKDWMGNPIPRLEATVRALSPELIEAVVDAGMADGTWAGITAFAGATTSIGVSTYPEKATATRAKFRDIVSKANYNRDWDELTPSQQNRLRGQHRKQFEVLSDQVRKESKGKALSLEQIKDEEIEAGKRIESMLSPEVKALVTDISVGVSRRPKQWYLNDKRYNRYMEFVADNIEKRLSKINFSRMNERRRNARIKAIITTAKNRAYAQLRSETRGK